MPRRRHHPRRFLFWSLLVIIGILSIEVFRLHSLYEQGQETQALITGHHDRETSVKVQKLKLFYMAQNERLWGSLAQEIAEATLVAAGKHRVDVGVLAGVISTESEAHPFAKSVTGAKGPGQVDFKAHGNRFPQIQEERDKYDPVKNIDCSAELLKEYVDKYGLKRGLQVYNVGEGGFRKGKRNLRYVSKVMKYRTMYRHF